jgi:hypothetical protein
MPIVQKGTIRAAGAYDPQEREITPYAWVHPDDDDRRSSRRMSVIGGKPESAIASRKQRE